MEPLEDLQAARIEVLARLALCFEVGDRAREVRIGRVGGVPTAAVFAELLGPAVLDRLIDRVSYLAAEILAFMIAEGWDGDRVHLHASRRPARLTLAKARLAAIGSGIGENAVKRVGPLPARPGHLQEVDEPRLGRGIAAYAVDAKALGDRGGGPPRAHGCVVAVGQEVAGRHQRLKRGAAVVPVVGHGRYRRCEFSADDGYGDRSGGNRRVGRRRTDLVAKRVDCWPGVGGHTLVLDPGVLHLARLVGRLCGRARHRRGATDRPCGADVVPGHLDRERLLTLIINAAQVIVVAALGVVHRG